MKLSLVNTSSKFSFGILQVKNSESAILMVAWTGMLGKNYCFMVLVLNATVVGACMAIKILALIELRNS